jgi:hypothetical protein
MRMGKGRNVTCFFMRFLLSIMHSPLPLMRLVKAINRETLCVTHLRDASLFARHNGICRGCEISVVASSTLYSCYFVKHIISAHGTCRSLTQYKSNSLADFVIGLHLATHPSNIKFTYCGICRHQNLQPRNTRFAITIRPCQQICSS